MKKNLLFLAFALISLTVSAQHTTPAAKVQQQQIAVSAPLHFGYFSFDKVFHTMPGYAIAKHNMDELRDKYDAETKRVETEFNAKYEEFLDGQRTYAKTILEKRQAELRELMEKNIAFKAEATRLLQQAGKLKRLASRRGLPLSSIQTIMQLLISTKRWGRILQLCWRGL